MKSRHALILLFNNVLAERHALMARSLRDHGWRVTVVAWDRSGAAGQPAHVAQSVDAWLWVPLPAPNWSARLLTKLPRFYSRLVQTIRCVEHYDLLLPTHLFLVPITLALPGKKLYDAFEMYALEMSFYFKAWAQPGMLKFWQWLEGLLVRHLDGVMTLDSRDGWLAQHYHTWQPRVQVIWNVPSRAQDPTPVQQEAVAHEYDNRRVITYVGGLMWEKGLRVSLEVAARIKERHSDVLFEFIGPMKDDVHLIQQMVQDLALTQHVRFVGKLPYTLMLARLHHAQLGLALHQQERTYTYVSCGTGRKFFTYMQAGLPIIGPNFGEIGLIIHKAQCGVLVDTTDPDEISQAVLDLLEHPLEAKRMGERGRQAFLEKYNWEYEEQKFLGFLNQVMAA